jgi:hypothetical protein
MKNEGPALSLRCGALCDREAQIERSLASPGILTVEAFCRNFDHLLPRHAQGYTEFLAACCARTFPAYGHFQVQGDFIRPPVCSQDICVGNGAPSLYNVRFLVSGDGERDVAHRKRLQPHDLCWTDKHTQFNLSSQTGT